MDALAKNNIYIVLVCFWTSQRVKLCKDIMNILHDVFVPTECQMGSLLQRCNGSLKGVLYDALYSASTLLAQLNGQSFARDTVINVLHTVCMYACRAAGQAAPLQRFNVSMRCKL